MGLLSPMIVQLVKQFLTSLPNPVIQALCEVSILNLQNQDNLFRKCKMTAKNRLYLNRRSVFHYVVSSEHLLFVQACGGVLVHKIS